MLPKRQTRWVEFLAEFDHEIVHRFRKSNVVADALSRLHVVECGVASKGHCRGDLFKGLE